MFKKFKIQQLFFVTFLFIVAIGASRCGSSEPASSDSTVGYDGTAGALKM